MAWSSNHRTCYARFMASFEKENDELQNQWMEYLCQILWMTIQMKWMASFCGFFMVYPITLFHNQIVSPRRRAVPYRSSSAEWMCRISGDLHQPSSDITVVRNDHPSYIYILYVHCIIYWTIMTWHNVDWVTRYSYIICLLTYPIVYLSRI